MRTRKLDVVIRNEIKVLNSRSKQVAKEIKQWENDTMFSSEFIADSISILNNELDSISKKVELLSSHKPLCTTIKSVLSELYLDFVYEKLPLSVIEELSSWDIINKSPYSDSFYNDEKIEWGYKPVGSLRVSDHWNFGDDREHCKTDIEICHGWALGQYDGEKYIILKEF